MPPFFTASLRAAPISAMATATPAGLLGLGDSHGRLTPGRRADLVRLGPDFQVVEHWL